MMPMYVEATEASARQHDELAQALVARLQAGGFTAQGSLERTVRWWRPTGRS